MVSRDARYNKDYNEEADPYVVNVYLGEGTHFFYTCNLEPTSTCTNDYCHESLVQIYQNTDNVIFNFLPLNEAKFPKDSLKNYYE